jgi:adenosylcobinamide-GDP ribazoletransferase
MIRSLAGAIQFLTVVRVPATAQPASPGAAAAWFPLVGAALGAAGAGVFLGLGHFLPISLAALATVAFWAAISGVLHEDGLADAADALRAGRSQDRVVAILKDPRIGTFGAVAVAISILARWQALEYMLAPNVWIACIAAQAVPRAAMVGLAWTSRPAGSGLGHALTSTLTTPIALFALAQGLIAAMLCGVQLGLMLIAGAYVIARLARWYFYSRLGGVNGDCLGATEQILEIYALLLFTVKL